MRVNEATGSQGRVEPQPGGFGAALRRARGGDEVIRHPAALTDRARGADRRPAAAPRAGLEQLGAPRDEGAPATVLEDPVRTSGASDRAPVPELAALVRTLPAALEASRVRDGAPLALSFGRSLEVDLRSGTAGVEVVLRPEPRLVRAAEAELPRVVAALRARGIAVARAEVRARGGAPRGAR
jgi:hypothetical protein